MPVTCSPGIAKEEGKTKGGGEKLMTNNRAMRMRGESRDHHLYRRKEKKGREAFTLVGNLVLRGTSRLPKVGKKKKRGREGWQPPFLLQRDAPKEKGREGKSQVWIQSTTSVNTEKEKDLALTLKLIGRMGGRGKKNARCAGSIRRKTERRRSDVTPSRN